MENCFNRFSFIVIFAANSGLYAHYVFNTLDSDRSGIVSFEVSGGSFIFIASLLLMAVNRFLCAFARNAMNRHARMHVSFGELVFDVCANATYGFLFFEKLFK